MSHQPSNTTHQPNVTEYLKIHMLSRSGKSEVSQEALPSVLRPVTTGNREVARQNNHARRMNLTGKRFGTLLVLSSAPSERHPNGRYYAMWYCKCDCGKRVTKSSMNLTSGDTKSCGCKTYTGVNRIKHGYARKIRDRAIYHVWGGMIDRCENPNCMNYHRYGGRGIRVCRRWRKSFINFLRDIGERPLGTSLDRKNNNRGYSPSNCRWATRAVQSNNTSRNKFITYRGRRLTLSQWAKRLGLTVGVFWCRLNKMHWSMDKIVKTPPRKLCLNY